jgi:hypothetical protein
MTIEAIVQGAILDRRALLLTYERDGQPARKAYPHALYLGIHREVLVETYQVAGFTKDGTLPAWHSFSVARIVSAEPLEERFEVAPGWDPDAPTYHGGIIAMV